MQHSNNIIGSSTIRTCIAIAAFACTLLAGTLTAEVVRTEQPKRGIDPIIHAILDGFESGNLRSGEELTQTRTLKPRSKTKKERVNVGHRNRLLVKFADELKVRITPKGQLVSRTNKSIQTVIEAALSLGVTLSPAAKVEESKVNELIARAEARSGKQMPDIGGVFWVDGSLSAVRAAADVFFIMPEVEWLDTPPLQASENAHRGEKLQKKSGISFNHPNERNSRIVQVRNIQGACMFRDNICHENISDTSCAELGGTFLGRGSVCKTTNNGTGEPRGGVAACCILFLIPDFSGPNLFCDDISFSACLAVNGIWHGETGDSCADLGDECPPDITEFNLCGSYGDLESYFTGDCYIDQTIQEVEQRITFAAGCLDSPGFPDPQAGEIIDPDTGEITYFFNPFQVDIFQECCEEISAFVPECGTLLWDHVCASYANSGDYDCSNSVGGYNGCQSPFGGIVKRSQPEMIFEDGCADSGFRRKCWPFNPAVSFFTPQPTTPDFFKMGLQAWATNETISFDDWGLTSVNALAQFLPYPMGGAVIGDVSYLINDWPTVYPNLVYTTVDPVTGEETLVLTTQRAQVGVIIDGVEVVPSFGVSRIMWGGEGLDLYPIDPDADPGGMNASDAFSGLYGLGDWHEQLNEGANGTYGANVKVAVLDYAAYIDTYSVVHEGVTTIYGAEHEELLNVKLEGPETGHDELKMYFDPNALFSYSAHHGTAVLGVIAADWDPENPDENVGIRGLVPEADIMFFPLVAGILGENGEMHGEGRSATAWINAMLSLEPGDVIAATYNPEYLQGGEVNNIDYNAFSHNQITIATALGISVVIGAGMTGTDLAEIDWPDEEDSGAIVVAAVSPGGKVEILNDFDKPYKRYCTGSGFNPTANDPRGSSNFTIGVALNKVTCSAWGAGVTTCGFGPSIFTQSGVATGNWLGFQSILYSDNCKYNVVASRSYTNNFGGTSAASAIVAGCVIALQGFALQMHETKLSPIFTRHFIGGGSFAGMTPTDPDVEGSGGIPIMPVPAASQLTTENDMEGGGNSWDFIEVDPGDGNLTGMFVNPWKSCQRIVVDPIFDTPGIEEIMIINGDYIMGNSGSIAALDSMYFSLGPVYKEVGDYPMPDEYTGPGNHVTYISTAWITDIYLAGELRGGLSPFNVLQWDVVMLDSTYTSTILLLYMWNFARQDWVQASTSVLLSQANLNDEGKHEVNFRVPRSSRMINQLGQYHARFVTVTQSDGDNQLFPYFYDQIRIQSGSFPGGPIVVP